jgi:hypothetical protein
VVLINEVDSLDQIGRVIGVFFETPRQRSVRH